MKKGKAGFGKSGGGKGGLGKVGGIMEPDLTKGMAAKKGMGKGK